LLFEKGVLKSRDAVRTSAKALADQLPGARFRFPFKAVDGDHALLHWSAQSANARVDLGADTFVIRDGRIVLQTVSYRLKTEIQTPNCRLPGMTGHWQNARHENLDVISYNSVRDTHREFHICAKSRHITGYRHCARQRRNCSNWSA